MVRGCALAACCAGVAAETAASAAIAAGPAGAQSRTASPMISHRVKHPSRRHVRAHRASAYPYRLIELPTLGGPQADASGFPSQILSANGLVTGNADTATPDPYGAAEPGGTDGYVAHAFTWRDGTITDLGALAPTVDNSSASSGINARGDVAGGSDTGTIDPLTGTIATHAVLWRDGALTDLGTLGGAESYANDINNADQVVGFSSNTVSDPYSMVSVGTQTRAFVWQHGTMSDLGTLGGSDAFAFVINNAGQVAGASYTNSTPNPTTGMPTMDPFLWQDGRMTDLGSLGGTHSEVGWINDRGQVVGFSDMPGDQTQHPFLWNGKTMIDLGTLGGDNGQASWVNDAGDAVGTADIAGSQAHHGFLYEGGPLIDLPPLDGAPCSNAFHINDNGESVGNATNCQGYALSAILWKHGTAIDLNTLIAPSQLRLVEADSINDAGVIEGLGRLPNGDRREFILIPNSSSAARPARDALASSPGETLGVDRGGAYTARLSFHRVNRLGVSLER
jgi:probable HAF family extracellular repeat protein